MNSKKQSAVLFKIFLFFSYSTLTPPLQGRILERPWKFQSIPGAHSSLVPDPGRWWPRSSHPQKVPQTVPWLFVPWPLLSSPLSAMHSPGPIACPMALAVSHVVQNGSQPLSHRRHLAPLSAHGPRIFPSLTVSRPSPALTMSTPQFHRPKPIVSSPRPAFTLSATVPPTLTEGHTAAIVFHCAQRLSILPQRIVSSPLSGSPVWTTPSTVR